MRINSSLRSNTSTGSVRLFAVILGTSQKSLPAPQLGSGTNSNSEIVSELTVEALDIAVLEQAICIHAGNKVRPSEFGPGEVAGGLQPLKQVDSGPLQAQPRWRESSGHRRLWVPWVPRMRGLPDRRLGRGLVRQHDQVRACPDRLPDRRRT